MRCARRYVDSDPEFYVPDVWRKKADNVKQGSSDEAVETLMGPTWNLGTCAIPWPHSGSQALRGV